MQGLQIKNLSLELLTSDPSSPADGRIWFNTTEKYPKIRANGLNKYLVAPDDDFNMLPLKQTLYINDVLPIWDYVAGEYKRIKASVILDQMSTVHNVYKTIYTESGTIELTAVEEDAVTFKSDGSLLITKGDTVGGKLVQYDLREQNGNMVFAGPVNDPLGKPTFRRLSDPDMPGSYNPQAWNDAYDWIQGYTNLEFWERNGTILNPMAAGDSVSLGSGDLFTDEIFEVTTDHGINVDGVLFKDSFIEFGKISTPTSPVIDKGRLYMDTTDEKLYWKTSTITYDLTNSSAMLNAYSAITDGTNTASAVGATTFKLRSADNKLSIVVTDNDATHGDNALFTINQGNIDHNSLLNYSSDRHFLMTDITSLSTSLSTGLVKITNGTGAISIITDNSTTWNAAQPGHANLTSLSGLTYVSASFVKMTAANTFTLDTNTYSLSDHNHSSTYEPLISKSTGYAKWTGSAWSFLNESYQAAHTNLAGISNLSWVSGTPFVKMTAAGTFGLDTTTYLSNTPAALTKTNDTNVTLTLGGTPATSLLQSVSLTLGWTGTLAFSRFVNSAAAGLSVVGRSVASAGVFAEIQAGTDGYVLRRSGTTLGFGQLALGAFANGIITYAKLQNVSATSRILGRITTGAGVMEELTGTQATTLLDNFTTTLKGLVPGSGGGTTNFLRADGTWAAPTGVVPVDSTLLDWSTDRYQPYSSPGSGSLDTSSTDPTGTTRLNYGGYFYATRVYSDLYKPDGSLQNISVNAGNASGAAGTSAGAVSIKGGDALYGDNSSLMGNIFIKPGNPYTTAIGSWIYFGDSSYNSTSINVGSYGSATNISLWISAKGTGNITLGANTTGISSFYGTSYIKLETPLVNLGFRQNTILIAATGYASHVKGYNLILKGGDPYPVGDSDGGDVLIYGGNPVNSGLRGNVFIGDGSANCYLPTDDTETFVVAIDSTTGLLSKRTVSSIAPSYTNATAMPETVHGWEAGSTFSNKTMAQMWDGLLYPYQYPAFTGFTFSGYTSPLECGDVIPAGNKTWTWTYTNGSNIEANCIDIDDITGSVNLITNTANDGTEVISIGASDITKTTTGQTNTWRITGTNTKSQNFTRDIVVTWYSPFYYGVGAQGLTVAQVQALTKTIVGKSTKVYSFSPSSQVLYFAYPASYGSLTSIKDSNGYETISDWTQRSLSFTNNPPNYKGITVSYYVYEFNNLTSLAQSYTFTF